MTDEMVGNTWTYSSAFPFSKTALEGKHALVFGASKGIGQLRQK